MRFIDNLLNRMTMYRLVVYGLSIIALASFVFAAVGRLSFSPTAMVISLALVLSATFLTDLILGKIWRVPRNAESWLITGLILFLIISPVSNVPDAIALFTAGVVACASKFIIAYNGKHIFNPAAFGAAVVSLTLILPVTWWVGSSALWPVSLVVGLAVVRKIRRFPLLLTFVVVAVIVQIVMLLVQGRPVVDTMHNVLLVSPLIFLSTIMLTEPATMPPRRLQQMIFGTIVAVLYVTAWRIGSTYVHPEVALLIGNIYAYTVSPKFRVRLQLKEIRKVSDRVYDYVFMPERKFNFLPGQYMEWTLPDVPFDSRGNRRTFTIASSPTETEVHLGLKYYDPPSMFKYTLSNLKPGAWLYASQLAGNFTLSGNQHKKLVFIAGGVGITPFRSMAKYLTDTKQSVDIILLYVVSDAHEFAYIKELREAASVGLKLVPIVTQEQPIPNGVVVGKLTPELITQQVPDFAERHFYISGPQAMVDATKRNLRHLHIPLGNIKTDHFSGY